MLSIKNLVKVYNTKGGVEVRALDGVSIDFPERGMVFLLGKSGSGKSTLLNVTGGLDMPTDGEIIVKGRSSKDFTASDFDSYRNTYIGFVFQDYNLLNEFTVEENIAIALRLQNKPNDKKAVDEILNLVDLGGLARRKPNTLSGGQKQRVAIARALIKNPEIIMADEPTGALDSKTGKQIFGTLKKLSETRLVIVVSHDRSFAEDYGDRIIELKDGHVISDKTKTTEIVSESKQNVTIVNDETITVKDWSQVTEDEIKEIVETMKVRGGETVITSDKKELPEIKKILSIDESSQKAWFKKTDKIDRKEYNGQETQFIKSRLPFAHALKMAGNGLKYKPFRLFFTILLSVIAFTLFGVMSTLMLYDPAYSVSKAMEGSHYQSVALEKRYDVNYSNVMVKNNGDHKISTTYDTTLKAAYSASDLEKLNSNSEGLYFAGVMDLGYYEYTGLSTGEYVTRDYTLRSIVIDDDYTTYFKVRKMCGFTDCGAEYMERNNFVLLAGEYPTNSNQVAISSYMFNLYKNASAVRPAPDFNYVETKDIIGKTIYVGDLNLQVSGVYDVGAVPEKYDILHVKNNGLDSYEVKALMDEMIDLIEFSFYTVGFVSENFYQAHRYDNVKIGYDVMYGIKMGRLNAFNSIARGDSETVYTPRSTQNYQYGISLLDTKGNQVPFKVEKDEVYLPILTVIKDNYTDFRNAILNLPEGQQAQYKSVLKSLNNYNADKATNQDLIDIYKAMTNGESYKTLTGQEVTIQKCYLKNFTGISKQLTVKGVYLMPNGKNYTSHYFISDWARDKYGLPPASAQVYGGSEIDKYESQYKVDAQNERYGMALTLTENIPDQSMFMLEQRENGVKYAMLNDVYEISTEIADMFDQMQLAFLVAGLVVGVFAALMLLNFISVGIENKKNEIGILRAVGARGLDVFKIFITEALLITLICFILSSVASAVVCVIINKVAVESIIQISFLNFRFVNVLFILGVSIIIALLGTLFPVIKAAKRTPVESIRAI